MSTERSHREVSLTLPERSRRWLKTTWLLRWRLRALQYRIQSLESQLADEFGLLETAPLHEELAALRSREDALLKRLSHGH